MAASVAPDRLSADQIAALVRRGDGNPFFVEQLLASGEVTMLSEELAELLRSRAAATTPAAHEILRVLAVAGRPLSDDELATVTGQGADRVRGALRELVGAALARLTADGLCTLRHALLGEAIEAALFAGERAELHAAVAGLLMDRADPSLAAEAAHHLRLAGREREELPVRITAAEYCDQVRGYAEASRHWARAVDLAEEFDDEHVAALALRAFRAAGRAGSADRFLDQAERGKRAARPARAAPPACDADVRYGSRSQPDRTLEHGLTEMQAAVDEFRGAAAVDRAGRSLDHLVLAAPCARQPGGGDCRTCSAPSRSRKPWERTPWRRWPRSPRRSCWPERSNRVSRPWRKPGRGWNRTPTWRR